MIDYSFKSLIFNTPELANHLRLYELCQSTFYRFYNHLPLDVLPYPCACKIYDYMCANFSSDYLHELNKIYHANVQRRSKLRKKFQWLIENYDCYFLTLTFADSYLLNTSESKRRKDIYNYLSRFNSYFIGNIDFGDTNGREHYHAIISIRPSLDDLAYYRNFFNSAICSEVVRKNNCSPAKLSSYVSKLTNHAIKVTTHRTTMLYNRKMPIPV